MANAYNVKWRVFDERATLTIRNPFNEDFLWQVASPTPEGDKKVVYKIKANGVANVPGGSIGTLCVYEIVNRLIMEANEAKLIWDENTRTKYENKILEKVIEPKYTGNVVDLGDTVDFTGSTKKEIKQKQKMKPTNVAVDFTSEEMLVEAD